MAAIARHDEARDPPLSAGDPSPMLAEVSCPVAVSEVELHIALGWRLHSHDLTADPVRMLPPDDFLRGVNPQ